MEENELPDDSILFADLNDEKRFELISTELLNKNARRILKEILRDNRNAPGIAEVTGLTIQDVLIHLKRLKEIGFVQEDSSKLDSFRGRRAKQYNLCKVAAVLVPIDTSGNSYLRKDLKKRAKDLLLRRTLVALIPTVALTIALFDYLFGSSLSPILKRAGLYPVNSNPPLAWLGQPYGYILSALVIALTASGLFLVFMFASKKALH
jgi:hypothetical protein